MGTNGNWQGQWEGGWHGGGDAPEGNLAGACGFAFSATGTVKARPSGRPVRGKPIKEDYYGLEAKQAKKAAESARIAAQKAAESARAVEVARNNAATETARLEYEQELQIARQNKALLVAALEAEQARIAKAQQDEIIRLAAEQQAALLHKQEAERRAQIELDRKIEQERIRQQQEEEEVLALLFEFA